MMVYERRLVVILFFMRTVRFIMGSIIIPFSFFIKLFQKKHKKTNEQSSMSKM